MSDNTPNLPAVQPEKRPAIAMGNRGVSFSNIDEAFRFSVAVHNSGMAPSQLDTPEKIMVAMIAGMEAGLTAMQAIQSVAIINRRPVMWGDVCLGLCSVRPDFEDIQEHVDGHGDNRVAVCQVSRKGRTKTLRQFSVPDAKKAGLWGKAGPWTQYPDRMLQMRARGFALRDSFPDALKGIGIREEIEDIRPAADPKPVPAVIEYPVVPESVAPTFQLEGGKE